MTALSLLFISQIVAAQTLGHLMMELRGSDHFQIKVELNGKAIPTDNLITLEIGDKAFAGANTLKVCFTNPSNKVAKFSERSEVKIRQKMADQASLLRVVNYRGKGEPCHITSFHIPENIYASLNKTLVPVVARQIDPAAEQVDQTQTVAAVQIQEAQSTQKAVTEPADELNLISEESPVVADERGTLEQDNKIETMIEIDGQQQALSATEAVETLDQASSAEQPLVENDDEIVMNPPENIENLDELEAVELPQEDLVAEGNLEELPMDEFEALDEENGDYIVESDELNEIDDIQELAANGAKTAGGSAKIKSILSGMGNISLLFLLVLCISTFRIVDKAGLPGWQGLIPVYNLVVLMKIVKMPTWNAALMFVPILNLLTSWKLSENLAKAFGQSRGFAAGLMLLPIVFYPILGFGNHEYQLLLDEHGSTDADIVDENNETILYEPTNVSNMTATIVDVDSDNTGMTEIAGFEEATEIAK